MDKRDGNVENIVTLIVINYHLTPRNFPWQLFCAYSQTRETNFWIQILCIQGKWMWWKICLNLDIFHESGSFEEASSLFLKIYKNRSNIIFHTLDPGFEFQKCLYVYEYVIQKVGCNIGHQEISKLGWIPHLCASSSACNGFLNSPLMWHQGRCHQKSKTGVYQWPHR